MNRHSRKRLIQQIEEYLAAWAELDASWILASKQGKRE